MCERVCAHCIAAACVRLCTCVRWKNQLKSIMCTHAFDARKKGMAIRQMCVRARPFPLRLWHRAMCGSRISFFSVLWLWIRIVHKHASRTNRTNNNKRKKENEIIEYFGKESKKQSSSSSSLLLTMMINYDVHEFLMLLCEQQQHQQKILFKYRYSSMAVRRR